MQHEMFSSNEAKKVESYKPDTLLGICEAVGNDLGFSPNLLRVALCCLLFFSPKLMIGAYLGLGVVVLASRLVFPKPRQRKGQRVAELVAA